MSDFNARTLADMRAVLDEATLSDADHRAVEAVVASVEAEWKTKHAERYQAGVAKRDKKHDEVISEAQARREEVLAAMSALRSGRLPVKDTRSGLRDIVNDHARLMEQHQAIEMSDLDLSTLSDMTPDEYQMDNLRRFPLLANGLPSLAQLVQQHHEDSLQKKRARAGRQASVASDDDQEELLKALPGRFPSPSRKAAARRHGWG